MSAFFPNGFENWTLMGGESVWVTVLYRYIPAVERCPDCDASIRVSVASAKSDLTLFRLECNACGWQTEALPDPEAK